MGTIEEKAQTRSYTAVGHASFTSTSVLDKPDECAVGINQRADAQSTIF